jgi:hypothetical protein
MGSANASSGFAVSLTVRDESQLGFCETSLISLCLFGRACPSFGKGAWGNVSPRTFPCGVIAMQGVASALSTPAFPIWLALRGGHWTTICCLDMDFSLSTSTFSTPATPMDSSFEVKMAISPCGNQRSHQFIELDGLHVSYAVSYINLCLEPPTIISRQLDSSLSGLLMEIAMTRNSPNGARQFYVLIANGSPHRPLEVGGRWYCRTCWFSPHRVYSFNAADASTCGACGLTVTQAGNGFWVEEAELPTQILETWQRRNAPPLLRLLRTLWPHARLA